MSSKEAASAYHLALAQPPSRLNLAEAVQATLILFRKLEMLLASVSIGCREVGRVSQVDTTESLWACLLNGIECELELKTWHRSQFRTMAGQHLLTKPLEYPSSPFKVFEVKIRLSTHAHPDRAAIELPRYPSVVVLHQ